MTRIIETLKGLEVFDPTKHQACGADHLDGMHVENRGRHKAGGLRLAPDSDAALLAEIKRYEATGELPAA